ncbi:hypothetical protein ES703_124211 [subsurface metagenome]
MLLSRRGKTKQEVHICPRGILGINANTLSTMRFSSMYSLHRHRQYIFLTPSTLELTINHLAGCRDRKVEMLDFWHQFKSSFHILSRRPNPSFQTDRLQDTHLLQFKICPQVTGLMPGSREAKFALVNSHFIQIYVYYGLFQFG